MTENIINNEKQKVILCAIYRQGMEPECLVSLDELEQLADTADLECAARLTQCRETPDVKTVFGKGKIDELKEYCENLSAELVVFDCELSPSQIRSIEDAIGGVSVIDRSMLILDIFAAHARPAEIQLPETHRKGEVAFKAGRQRVVRFSRSKRPRRDEA